MFGLLKRQRRDKPEEERQEERQERFLPQDDPLALAVNRAWNTGEPVAWSEGEPLPDPGGPNRPVER